MEKKTEKVLLYIKSSIVASMVIAIAVAVCGEFNMFVDYVVEPKGEDEFILNLVTICLTIIGVPLTLKFYSLCINHSLRRMDNDEALNRLLRYALVRSLTLCAIAVVDMCAYYLTFNITGAMCALVVGVIMLMCWPKRKQIDAYLEKVNQE